MSEVRALLLTDVVDSTQLAASIGDDAMAQAWIAHDRVARDLLLAHGGREIDKTDGMLMMFAEATAALAFARDYHRALATLPMPLQARAGLHVGPVILRENTAADVAMGAKPVEVDGVAKPTAARVMAMARGCQTLLTAAARDALARHPDGASLKFESHGHWIVKGVAEPVEIFEADEPGTMPVAPSDSDKAHRVVKTSDWWLPVRDIPHNLPFQSTSFVGREKELAEVKTLLDKARLVTLLGMGGLGKTRVSLRAAAELIHRFPDGVWFVDLAPLRDDALVVAAAVQVIGVQPEPDRAPLQSLCAHLRSRRALIVLDNCEHLLKPAAELANAVLKTAPHVRIIASSREALHVPGEHSYPLHPLTLPGSGAGIAEMKQSPAVQLFVERARQHRPAFALDAAHASAVAELVARLEGIPLALELAAARIRALNVTEINARLKDRYRILTGGASVLQERQQTLRALVDWSYDLLNETEQALLARLGIFVGGFDLSAAEQVCGTPPMVSDDVLDVLGSLVEKSLVLLDENDGGSRYRMLETIRDYAREKLQARGELASVAARHCDYYFALTKQANVGMRGPEQGEWIQRLEADLDNVRSAMTLALAGAVDQFIAVKMAVAMLTFWTLRGYATEGRNLVRSALALPAVQASDVAHAWALYVGAGLAESQSDYADARQMLEACLVLRRRLDQPIDIAATLSTLSVARLHEGDAGGAEEGQKEALLIFRELGDRRGEAICLVHLGTIAAYRGDGATSKSQLEEGLTIARDIRHQQLEGECELLLGQVAFMEGDAVEGERRFKRSLTVCREAADRRGEANALRWLGKCDRQRGDEVSARSRLAEALRAFRTFDMWEELLDCLDDMADLAHVEGDADLAVLLSAATAKARDRMRLARCPRAEQSDLARLARLRQALGAEFDSRWNEGRSWDVEDAVRSALEARSDAASVTS